MIGGITRGEDVDKYCDVIYLKIYFLGSKQNRLSYKTTA